MKKRYVISFLISLAILVYLAYQVDISRVGEIISGADMFFVSLAFVGLIASLSLKIVRWGFFLNLYKKKVKPKDVASSLLASLFIANVTPARVGEVSRPYFLKKKYKTSFFEILPSIIIERFLDLIILLIYSVLFLLFFSIYASETMKFVLILISFVVVFGLLLLTRKKWIKFFVKKVFGLLSLRKYKTKIDQMIDRFYKGFLKLKSMKLFYVVLITSLIWLSESTIFFLSLNALSISIPFIFCVGFISIAVLGGTLSSLPGGLGSTEAILFIFLVSVPIAEAAAFSAIILYRFISLGLGLLISSPFFFKEVHK